MSKNVTTMLSKASFPQKKSKSCNESFTLTIALMFDSGR